MSKTAKGTFQVQLIPGPQELDGVVARFELSKTFHGDLEAEGKGIMLSGGDPQSGSAGYVAIETVNGRLDGARGGFVMQQLGMMNAGSQALYYEVVPGSGSGDLIGLAGALRLTIDSDGTHHYELEYEFTG